jgi:predicted extracellular nuclease
MGRGALKIDVEAADGFPVRLVTCHLKSKLITYPSDNLGVRFAPRDENERAVGESLALFRRTAEAGTIRMYINQLMQAEPDFHTIVLGDLNDEPGAATTQQILGPADLDVTTDDKLDAVRLYNLGDVIPCKGAAVKTFLAPDRSFSRIYNDRRELIDHILVSKGLLGKTADLRKGLWQVREVRCLVEKITTIGDNPGDRIGDIVPDHAPVMASFSLP